MNEQQLHHHKALDLIMLAGEILLHNGAEIFRVQETMEHMAKAYGVHNLQIYAIANGIFVTVQETEFQRSTQIKHIPLSIVHLGRVTAVNQLSREITQGMYSLDEATQKLKQIETLPTSSLLLQTIAASIGSGCFCYIFGGTLFDSSISAIAGVFLSLFLSLPSSKTLSKVLRTILASMLVTAISFLLYALGLGNNINNIIIGSIIPLVPGVAITTSIRDYFNGDYLSGTIHLTDAILVALCIAIGVGSTIQGINFLGLS